MAKVLVIGSTNIDFIIQVPALPRPGETIIGHQMDMANGGKGANQAVAVARMGIDTRFVTSVGKDQFGINAIEGFKHAGIDTAHIYRSEVATGTAFINISSDGENSITVNPGANAELKEYMITPDLYKDIDILLLQLEVPVPTVLKAIDLAGEFGVKVILNPAPAQHFDRLPFEKLYLFTPNETETEFFTGIEVKNVECAKEAAKVLHDKGLENLVITMGEKGVFCSFPSFQKHMVGFKVKAVDTTAAGDVFNGALVAGLKHYSTLENAIKFAQAAAALSVTRLGAQPSIPVLQKVKSFLSANAVNL